MKGYFKKGLVFGIIFLFLGAGVVPTISTGIENENKQDLSESSLQLPEPSQNIIIGLMLVTASGSLEGSHYIEVRAITKMAYVISSVTGEVTQPFVKGEFYMIYDFIGIAKVQKRIVIGMFSYFELH